jgi:hypothetical protein
MAWAYDIRDSNDASAGSGNGFSTEPAARAAGTAEAERLKRTGNMPGNGSYTVLTTQDSSEPWQ